MSQKNTVIEKSYWDDFYSTIEEFEIPSQFCALLASEVSTNKSILEFGCGNGRDSLFLARHGYNVCAVDLSMKAIEKCNKKSRKMDSIIFQQGDISIESDVYNAVASTRGKNKNNSIVIYSRFFLHSIDDKQEQAFFEALSKYLNPDDVLYLEFRSIEDEAIDKIYTAHFRRYINTNSFMKYLTNEYGFKIIYNITGQGLAKYKSEDPFISRVIATKL